MILKTAVLASDLLDKHVQEAVSGKMPILPIEHWNFAIFDEETVGAGIFDNDGHLFWLKFKIVDAEIA